jgi:flavodoxin
MQACDGEASVSVQIVEYSDRSIAVFGDTKTIKEELKELGGRFNKYLKHDGETKAGWIFPLKDRADVEELIVKLNCEADQAQKPPTTSSEDLKPSASHHTGGHNLLIIENNDAVASMPYAMDYTDKSFAVFGETKPIKEELKDLGGRFNKYLKHDGVTKAGWIFPLKARADVEELIIKFTAPAVAVKKRKADSL